MKYTEYNEEHGRNAFGNQFEKQVTQMTALDSLLVGEELQKEELPLTREFKCVKDFLDLPMNDRKETVLKKLFATAVVAAKNSGALTVALPDSPLAIAGMVDEGLNRLKIAYKTSVGEMDSVDAVDALIDSVAVRTMTVIDKVVDKGMPIVIDKVCVAVAAAYPPARTVVPIIKACEKHIVGAARAAVRKGIMTLQRVAKPIVREAVTKVRSVAKKVLNILNAY